MDWTKKIGGEWYGYSVYGWLGPYDTEEDASRAAHDEFERETERSSMTMDECYK